MVSIGLKDESRKERTMSTPIDPSEQGRRRWGGLSVEPEKAARQLAGLARNNPTLAARLGTILPGDPGEMPGDAGNLPGEATEPGETPGASRDSPGKQDPPSNMPGSAGESRGKDVLPGKVVPGRYWSDNLEASGPGEEDSPPAEVAPLNRFGRFYARMLGYDLNEERGAEEGVRERDEGAPKLNGWWRFYARLNGHDV
jgi:hypothetical protein